MSTILKALKKVEGKRAVSTVKLDMPATPVIQKAKSSNGLKWLVVAGLLLIVVLSTVAGYQFWGTDKPIIVAQKTDEAVIATDKTAEQAPTTETPLTQELLPDKQVIDPALTASDSDSSSSTLESDEVAIAPKPLPQEVLPDKPVIKPVPISPELPIKKPEVVEGIRAPKPLPKKSSAQSLPSKPSSPSKGAVAKQNARQRASKDPLVRKQLSKMLMAKSEPNNLIQPQSGPKATVQPATAPQKESTVERKPKKPDIPILEDRSLEIQALVYSDDAAKRMIVLNGEILRQGYEYKGYTIETIESQRVLVKKNGKVSALLFGR